MSEHRKMPGRVRVVMFVALGLVLVAAVSVPLAVGAFRLQPAATAPSGPKLRVCPSELFTGELKRIEPHLGMTSGCVKLERVGLESDIYIGTRYELRRAGQPPQDLGEDTQHVSEPAEASFSVRPSQIPAPDGKRHYDFVVAVTGKAGGSSTRQLPEFWPESGPGGMVSRSPLRLSEPKELSEKEEVPVWAYAAHPLSGKRESDLQKAIDTSQAALVVYLWWERGKR